MGLRDALATLAAVLVEDDAHQPDTRAGHGVDVLPRVYAKCIDGGEERSNRRIDEALGRDDG